MRYEMRVTAYDVMDQVTVTVQVYGTTEADPAESEHVVSRVSHERGTGELDPLRWTRAALVQALENL